MIKENGIPYLNRLIDEFPDSIYVIPILSYFFRNSFIFTKECYPKETIDLYEKKIRARRAQILSFSDKDCKTFYYGK